MMYKNIISVFCLLILINGLALGWEDDILEIESGGSYRLTADSPTDLAKEVAIFKAKRHAIELAGRYLLQKRLTDIYGSKGDEISCLAAKEIQVEILEEKVEKVEKTSTYHVRIRAQIRASDFIKAELEDAKQEKEEERESYREEMEQQVSAAIDPGKDIAKVYRLLRQKKWRVAMIYLNHLEKKYPSWDSIYMAKAITHYVSNEPVFMKKALYKACNLGNQMACDDLKKLRRINEYDFGLSIVD